MIHAATFTGDGHYCPRCGVAWDQGDPEPPDCLPSAVARGTQPIGPDAMHIRHDVDLPGMEKFVDQVSPPRRSGPLGDQIGGNHYKGLAIQPTEFCMQNRLDACVHGILKYVTRHRSKNGVEDLRKARHYVEIREVYALDLAPPGPTVITMLEYVTRNGVRPDDAEVLYRLEAYYNASSVDGGRVGARRLIEEMDRLIQAEETRLT